MDRDKSRGCGIHNLEKVEMTTQCCDQLTNFSESLKHSRYKVLGVYTGHLGSRTEYCFSHEPDIVPDVINSSCWKGYIAHFVLTESGTLLLEKYEDLTGTLEPVDEQVDGDFWVALGVSHDRPAYVHIPFENGRITCRAKWDGNLALLDSSIDEEISNDARALSYLDDMRDIFVRSACSEDGLDASVASQRSNHGGGSYDLTALDGMTEKNTRNLKIIVEYENEIEDILLAATLRLSGIPLFLSNYENGWVAWDEQTECLRTGPSGASLMTRWMTPKSQLRDKALPDSADGRLLHFMRRCAISTDHGKKPLLIQRVDMAAAARGEQIEVIAPRTIGPAETNEYMLAFHDASGHVLFLPLADIVRLGIPLHVRNATYYERNDHLYPSVNQASLLANAFLQAKRSGPLEFDYFRLRAYASVFESVIERISPPKNLSSSPFDDDEPNEALSLAKGIEERSKQLPYYVYITSGGHPLDDTTVTTPELLRYAIEKLDSHGWVRHQSGNRAEFKMTRKADIPDYGKLAWKLF